jgi:hypothetical protein
MEGVADQCSAVPCKGRDWESRGYALHGCLPLGLPRSSLLFRQVAAFAFREVLVGELRDPRPVHGLTLRGLFRVGFRVVRLLRPPVHGVGHEKKRNRAAEISGRQAHGGLSVVDGVEGVMVCNCVAADGCWKVCLRAQN